MVKISNTHHRTKDGLVKKNPKKKEIIEWGFDLTGFDSAEQFEMLLERNGLHPEKSFKLLTPYKESPETHHYQWSNPYIKIITGNNPITGEYSNPKWRQNEKGYASYIGIKGYRGSVLKMVKDIKNTTDDIKGESRYKRDFI